MLKYKNQNIFVDFIKIKGKINLQIYKNEV